MLQELSIRNFAIIEKLNIEFNSGMTVLTGETGRSSLGVARSDCSRCSSLISRSLRELD